MAAGRVPDDGGAGVGTSLLSRLAFGAKARTTPTGQTRAEKTRERTRTGSARGAADRSGTMTSGATAEQKANDPNFDMSRLEPALQVMRDILAAVPELRANVILAGGELLGFDMAVNLFKHYLGASGDPISPSLDQVHAIEPIKAAEEANRTHFERVFLDPTFSDGDGAEFHTALKDLEDGETIRLSNVKVFESLDRLLKQPGLMFTRPGFSFSIGGTNVRATGDFVAERRGNTIFITGKVRHAWHERYDFESPDDLPIPLPYQLDMTILEFTGHAAPFSIDAEWDQRVTGTIEIVDGKLGAISLRWTDEPASDKK